MRLVKRNIIDTTKSRALKTYSYSQKIRGTMYLCINKCFCFVDRVQNSLKK